MEWFNGTIVDAVRISKERGVIFVVFIDGKTDDSIAVTELLNNAAVARKLSDPTRYLAVRIESDTDSYTQFAQIYRLVPVPSLFFIGKSGQPIEIVAGKIENVAALQERIAVAEGIFYTKTTQPDGPATAAAAAASSSNSSAAPAQVAKKPVEKKPEPKRDDKQAREDLEMQKLKEERKREKAQDEEARRRVLEQIKLDRFRRQDAAPIITSQPNKPATSTPVRNLPDSTRIQFRKPTGETIVDTFKSDGPFGDVWKYAKASVDFKDFVLATSMPPRRELSAEHSDQTLIELNLAPSAVLLVIPLTKPSLIGGPTGAGVVATISNFLFTIFWTLMTPILALWNRLRGVQPARRPDRTPAQTEEEAPGPNIGSEILQKRNLARYNLGPSAPTPSGSGSIPPTDKKPSGNNKSNSNIHRLKDYDSDDNESNTYNGNSTQQM